ncbi:MAG: hypothetical protein JO294_14975 [Alphaproteobacteria bacterium]|nr:hypothetical protein [Alphaproteobacteria bacterium]
MAAQPLPSLSSPATPEPDESVAAPYPALAKLSAMHAEAVETAELSNLLGRSLHVAIALPVLALATVLLAGGAGIPSTIAWLILVAVATLSIARAYGHAIHQPFERTVLHAFWRDINACLLYAGFAWGAGAFLGLAAQSSVGVALLFAAAPPILFMTLLRERESVLLFLAPVAALTSFACVLRPFSGGALSAALVLIACAIVAGVTVYASRRLAAHGKVALPQELIAQ